MNKSIWEFFVENPKLTNIIVGAIVLLGFVSIIQIPKESNPEVNVPIGVVSTTLVGASADDVEQLITDPIEAKLKSLDNLDSFTSVSQPGVSIITVSFNTGIDSFEAISDLRTKVDNAKPDLPNDIVGPNIQQISFNDQPILTFALSGPFSTVQLNDYAEVLEKELEKVSGVSSISILGAPERKIQIALDKTALDRFGLSLSQVNNAINSSNVKLPIGAIETGDAVYNIKLDGQLETAEDIKEIPLLIRNGVPIVLSDVAKVYDTYTELGTISRFSELGSEPVASISMQVYKSDGGNILQVAEQSKVVIADTIKDLSDQLNVNYVTDDAETISKDLNNLLSNGYQTILIILALLFVFLGWREALIASLSVPLTFLITFIFLTAFGLTLNFLTLFALILGLGILVDSAIVITEGIHENLLKKKSPKQAVVDTIREFKAPLISGTMTTIFVFLPMLMTSGIIGQFIKSIPITITILLLASIFVSLAIITTYGGIFLREKDLDAHKPKPIYRQKVDDLIAKIYATYSVSLNRFLTNWEKSRRLLVTIFALFVLSISLAVTGTLKINMFPAGNEPTFSINLELPKGTTLLETNQEIKKVEQVLAQDKRIESFITSVGSASTTGSVAAGGNDNTNLAGINVRLFEDIDQNSEEVIADLESKFKEYSRGTIAFSQLANGPEQGAPIQIKVFGPELDTLNKVATTIKDELAKVPGTKNVELSTGESSGEFVFSVDRIKAQAYGVSTFEVASLLRSAVTGSTVTTLKDGQDDVDVVVSYDLNSDQVVGANFKQITLDDLKSLNITTQNGTVPIRNFLNDSIDSNRPQIDHDDAKRVVIVSSAIQPGFQSQSILGQFQPILDKIELPEDYTVSFGGESEDINQSFADLGRAMIIGILMIAILLVYQFKSYTQPFLVLLSIPLALIGVFPGLVLVGQPLSFPAAIGVVALAGIVVNNGIILIDRINFDRQNGSTILDAVREASKSRLQPIILTTATTVAGILPLAVFNPDWGPLGYSIVFGLLFSTILTLYVVPILYLKLETRLQANAKK